jgi:glycerol kinase
MQADSGVPLHVLKVDGGASVNNLLMQLQADAIGTTVCRPGTSETTALGAAYLAGLAVGYWDDQQEIAQRWALDHEFHPHLPDGWREPQCQSWQPRNHSQSDHPQEHGYGGSRQRSGNSSAALSGQRARR